MEHPLRHFDQHQHNRAEYKRGAQQHDQTRDGVWRIGLRIELAVGRDAARLMPELPQDNVRVIGRARLLAMSLPTPGTAPA
jgi:hypothetical protein